MGELIQKTSTILCGDFVNAPQILFKKKMNQCSLFLMCVFVWITLSLGGLFGHGVSFPKEFNDIWLIIHTLVRY